MFNKNLLKKTGIYFIGNLSSKVLSALLIPIFAFNVNASELGYFDFSQTIMGIVTPIVVLAIWEGVLKFILSDNDLKNKRAVLSTAAIFSIVMSLVFVVIAFLFHVIFFQNIQFFGLIVIMISLHTFVYVWQYSARAFELNKLFVISGISSTVVNFVSIIFLIVIFDFKLLGLFISYILGQMTIIYIIEKEIKVFSKLKIKDFNMKILKKLVVFSSPLVLNLISAWAISGFGRLIITLKLGEEANGLYSFANRFSLLITMVGTVVTMAIIEEAILSLKNKTFDENFNKTIESLFKIFQYIIILAMPTISVFYYLLKDTEYYASLVYVPFLLMYAMANTLASNIGAAFQALSKTQLLFTTTFLGALVTVLFSVLFIDSYGVNAVVLGQVLGAITMLITRYIFVNKYTSFKIKWNFVLVRLVSFILIASISLNANIVINLLILLLIISFLVYINKSLLNSLFQKINRP